MSLSDTFITQFYRRSLTRVRINKDGQKLIWHAYKKRESQPLAHLYAEIPALAAEITRATESGNNIQSAVFSECVYAQALADMFELNHFVDCRINQHEIPADVVSVMKDVRMVPRYLYYNDNLFLVQAGGRGSVDAVVIDVSQQTPRFTFIEFKEYTGAKTTEPDLPPYGEDGRISNLTDFVEKNPGFASMLSQHTDLNFFEHRGRNVSNFTPQSVIEAVSGAYQTEQKKADIVCTVDKDDYLVAIPATDLADWARLEGEIRPTGRNPYKVWTPTALLKDLKALGAIIDENGLVTIEAARLETARQRGGNNTVSRYKIAKLYFVKAADCSMYDRVARFNIKNVKQLRPTISAKVFFSGLSASELKKTYSH